MSIAPHATVPWQVAAPSSSASEVRERLLMDESIVGRILELVRCEATTMTGPAVLEAIKRTHAVLHTACCVCRCWRSCGAKPMLVVLLQQRLCAVTLVSDFIVQVREKSIGDIALTDSAAYRGAAAAAWAGFGETDRNLVRWLIGGYENGLNSVVAIENGQPHTEVDERILSRTGHVHP